jgi:hypothetical protein
MNQMIRLGGVLLCAASLSACATITRGTRQNYVIETDPPGAQITLSTGQHCVTPCTLRLKRKDEFTVTATMDGYERAEAEVRSRMRAGGGTALAGNAIFGGIVGGVVDASNGSLNDLRPNPLHITMTPVGGAAPLAASQAAPAEAPAAAPAEAAAAPGGAPQSE